MISINGTIIPTGHHVTIALPVTGGFRTARDGYRVGPRPRLQGASLGGR